MTTIIWVNIYKIISSKEAAITDDTGEPVPHEAFLAELQNISMGGCHPMGCGR